MSAQARLLEVPAAGLYPIAVDEANRLLTEWGHKLGACTRPFHSEAFALEVHGAPIALAISASIVSASVRWTRTDESSEGLERGQVVELARLAACERWACRVMLRLWREICAPSWPCWAVRGAVSYSHNAMHSGDLYRFDGWTKMREDCGSGGGGTWSKSREADAAVAGRKTLWLWRYPEAA